MTKRLLDDCVRLAKILVHKHTQHFQHYTFVVRDNKIIEWGTNKSAEPLIFLGYSPHQKIHSEFMAWRAAKGLLHGKEFEMVNVRLGKKSEIKISKPCEVCYAWLLTLNCSHIWYTTSSGIFEKM